MVLKGTFNNISVISWRSVLLVEETRVPRENLLQVTGLYNSYQLPLSKENIFTRQQKYVTCRSIIATITVYLQNVLIPIHTIKLQYVFICKQLLMPWMRQEMLTPLNSASLFVGLCCYLYFSCLCTCLFYLLILVNKET